MQLIKNPTAQQVIKVVTIAGASVLVVGAAMSIFKAKSLKEAILPGVSILVGVAAFGYAMNKKILIAAPTTTEQKSSASGVGSGSVGATTKVSTRVPCNQGGTYCEGGRMCKNGFCV